LLDNLYPWYFKTAVALLTTAVRMSINKRDALFMISE
jgi:hypothetical protein